MLHWIGLAVGLMFGSAQAADKPIDKSEIHQPAMKKPAIPEPEKALTDAEKKRAERLAALEATQSKKSARVVVLKWQGKDVDYTNATLIRMVKTRIARPDAKFYPEIDLYQIGRKEPDPAVRAGDQRAIVPLSSLELLKAAVDEVAPIPWDGMSESEWGLKANELRDLTDEVWFVDRPELREPLFQLYVYTGLAAENQNNPAPPFYQQVGGMTVNYYWYLAGAMAYEEPGLMSKLTDQDLYASIDYYKQLLDAGRIKPMTLGFEEGGVWDAKTFAGDYEVFINGLPILIEDKDGLKQVAPGKVDVFLKRADGSFSLSDAVDITELEGKIYFVRDVARKKMGIDFIDQLMEHPNECTPELDGEIMNSLSIYAKLHPDAEVYVALPDAGNTNRILIWRWDRPSATLQKVLDNTGGFPVRFAVIGGTGIVFSGASVAVDQGAVEAPEGTLPTEVTPPSATPTLAPAGVPFNLQMRAHLSRLMLVWGIEGSLNITGNSTWQELYQVDGDGAAIDEDGNLAIKSRKFNTLGYGGIGVVLMKDAAVGIGPRGYVRFGGYNLPHAFDITGHLGMTLQGPLGGDGRIRSLIDVDGFGGVVLPYGDSLMSGPAPTFGLVASIGITF